MPIAAHLQRGRWAERRACRHLRLRGWRICARNWYGRAGELDIVASRWRTLLIAEVRYRPSLDAAWASIDERKLSRIRACTRELCREHKLQAYRLRLELIAIDAKGTLARRRL